MLHHTGFDPALNGGRPVRLVREDGTPIRPEDVSVGGQITVFPGIPGGTTNEYADSPTLLIHLRQQDADGCGRNSSPHAPADQGEHGRQLRRVLEDLHARRLPAEPVRAADQPAALPVPPVAVPHHRQRPAGVRPGHPARCRCCRWTLDDEGYFVAASDYKVPVGPSFWERPMT